MAVRSRVDYLESTETEGFGMSATTTSVLEMVRNFSPAERAEVLTELLNADLGTASDTRVLKLPKSSGTDEVIYLAVNRSKPPADAPPTLTEAELAELRIRIAKIDEAVDLNTFMKLVDREVAKRIEKS